jgi:hypothetical protein
MSNSEKKTLNRKIQNIIVQCSLGEPCDEPELDDLAVEYATKFRCAFKLAEFWPHDLENSEKKEALRLENKVNNIILRYLSAFGSNGRVGELTLFHKELGNYGKTWKHYKPKPKASPKKACSPKTRRSCNILGGKRRTRIKSKRRH